MMAVTTAAAVVMVFVFAVAAAFTIIASAALMAEVVQHVLYLLVGGQTVFKYDACKLQRLSCQWMVGIDSHAVLLNLLHAGDEAMLFLVHQCDDGAGIDVVVVEVAVDGEHLALQLVHTFFLIFTEGVGGGQGEIELFARLHVYKPLFKTVKGESEAADKCEGLSLLCLFFQVGLAVAVDGVELIAH